MRETNEASVKTFLTTSLLIILTTATVFTAEYSVEQQHKIILDYMYVTGQAYQQASQSLAADSYEPPVKCGTPAVLAFNEAYDKLDKTILKSSGVDLVGRPANLPLTYDSPSGIFRIHYTTTGTDAVRSDIANYVQQVGAIFDSVYVYMIDTLGYPAPPSDEFYDTLQGGDYRFDIYLRDLGPNFFGLTYVDSGYIDGPASIRATAFMELDNDYATVTGYENRPLDAVRVTAAHEFFHVVQFGIDFTEAEITDGVFRSYWMEMSATWMEEVQYDHINDYYTYLPFFFDDPAISIQRFRVTTDFHPYASVVFPLYLSEKFDNDIIKEIWLRCGTYGIGASFLRATSDVLDSVLSDPNGYEKSFSEFALWNYFTGSRADLAPAGVGYSERADYMVEFEDDMEDGPIKIHFSYPDTITNAANFHEPQHNAAYYMQLTELQSVIYDTTYWDCNAGVFPSCTDSTQVTDTLLGYDFLHIDSLFTLLIGLDPSFPGFWGMNILYQTVDDPDSVIIDKFLMPPGSSNNGGSVIQILDPHQYEKVTLIFTPASYVSSLFAEQITYYVGSLILERTAVAIPCETKEDVFVVEPQVVCSPLAISPLDATVTTSIGSFENGQLCFQVDSSGLYTIEVIAEFAGIADTCELLFPVTVGSIEFATPFPNPAVVAEMSSPHLSFKVAIPPGLVGLNNPYVLIDIYNIAGEYVATLEYDEMFAGGEVILDWDMKNNNGKEIASGVYIAYSRLYTSSDKTSLLTESKSKVAVIR